MVAEVERTRERSGWSVRRTLDALGVSATTFYRHKHALSGNGTAPAHRGFSVFAATPEERAAVTEFARHHPELRHRALTWTMVDRDVACLSASTVYRILKEEGLIHEWRPKEAGSGSRPPRPAGPNELWQTDIRYVKVLDHTFFLVVFLDVFSRFLVYHELLRRMDGSSVSLAAQSALESLASEARGRVRIQSDNGSAYISADFARVLREHGVGHHRIWPHTPEQNGHVERAIRTLGEPLHEDELETFAEAERATGEIVHWYNHDRLHSSIDYLTPATVHFGRAEAVLAERRHKLAAARQTRKEKNLKLRQHTLPLPRSSASPEPDTSVNTRVSHFA